MDKKEIYYIKDIIKDCPLYDILLQRGDNFTNTLMEKSFKPKWNTWLYLSFDSYLFNKATHICYTEIIKANNLSVIEDIMNLDNNNYYLAKAAIKQYNRAAIELLYKKKFEYHNTSRIRAKKQSCGIVSYAYELHGFEIIQFFIDIGVRLYNDACFFAYLFETRNKNVINYLIEIAQSEGLIDDLFPSVLSFCENKRDVIKTFIDKIDIEKITTSEIYPDLSKKPTETIQLLMEYGILFNNEALKYAIYAGNMPLIEFFLQCGLQVSEAILRYIFDGTPCHPIQANKKNILELFMKYNVDFSIMKFDDVDTEFLSDLENHGLDTAGLLTHYILFGKK